MQRTRISVHIKFDVNAKQFRLHLPNNWRQKALRVHCTVRWEAAHRLLLTLSWARPAYLLSIFGCGAERHSSSQHREPLSSNIAIGGICRSPAHFAYWNWIKLVDNGHDFYLCDLGLLNSHMAMKEQVHSCLHAAHERTNERRRRCDGRGDGRQGKMLCEIMTARHFCY